MPEVYFNHHSFAYVRVYIRAPDAPPMSHLSYKIDTGANRTTIGKNFLFDLGYDVCRFNLIPGKRKVLFNQKEQSMHSLDEVNNSTLE